MTQRTRFDEVLVRVIPGAGAGLRASSARYDVYIYTDLDLGLPATSDWSPPDSNEIAGLPFARQEHIVVRWSRYDQLLNLFHEGEKAQYEMRSRIVETMSAGLEQLFSGAWTRSRPARLWWWTETPELAALPWELVAIASGGPRFSFVRGAPADWVPILPVAGQLRLAVIDPSGYAPAPVRAALESYEGAEWMTGRSLRDALHSATTRGFELVHVFADASLTRALEPVLEFHRGDGAAGAKLSPLGEAVVPSEVYSVLRGSRVTLLALSPPSHPAPDAYDVPTVYRAFANMPPVDGEGPSVLATLGPADPGRAATFWADFYTHLNDNLSMEDALVAAQEPAPLPLALFLRQRIGREFSRRASGAFEPARVKSQLDSSKRLMKLLRAIEEKYPDIEEKLSASAEVVSEEARQEELDASLEDFRQLDADEQ